MVQNYSRELDKLLAAPEIKGKKLFLHSCCAPCSSYVLEYLRPFFRITVFYFNPNITEREEYDKRKEEQKRLIAEFNRHKTVSEGLAYPIEVVEGEYRREDFFQAVRGLEQCPEGGERCLACFGLRLRETARMAAEHEADYFTTTLTISPLKNAAAINEIGQRISKEWGIPFLPSDFKKKGGYQRSLELSGEYGLYRQDFCGCIFSKREREEKKCLAQKRL